MLTVRSFQASRRIRRLADVLGVVAAASLVLSVIERIQTGRGVDLYLTKAGIQVSAVGIAAFMVLAALTVFAVLVARRLRGRASGGSER